MVGDRSPCGLHCYSLVSDNWRESMILVDCYKDLRDKDLRDVLLQQKTTLIGMYESCF